MNRWSKGKQNRCHEYQDESVFIGDVDIQMKQWNNSNKLHELHTHENWIQRIW